MLNHRDIRNVASHVLSSVLCVLAHLFLHHTCFQEQVRDLELFTYLIIIFSSSLHLNEALKDEDIKKCHREVVSLRLCERTGWFVVA